MLGFSLSRSSWLFQFIQHYICTMKIWRVTIIGIIGNSFLWISAHLVFPPDSVGVLWIAHRINAYPHQKLQLGSKASESLRAPFKWTQRHFPSDGNGGAAEYLAYIILSSLVALSSCLTSQLAHATHLHATGDKKNSAFTHEARTSGFIPHLNMWHIDELPWSLNQIQVSNSAAGLYGYATRNSFCNAYKQGPKCSAY